LSQQVIIVPHTARSVHVDLSVTRFSTSTFHDTGASARLAGCLFRCVIVPYPNIIVGLNRHVEKLQQNDT